MLAFIRIVASIRVGYNVDHWWATITPPDGAYVAVGSDSLRHLIHEVWWEVGFAWRWRNLPIEDDGSLNWSIAEPYEDID
jgi:hypothetical protein